MIPRQLSSITNIRSSSLLLLQTGRAFATSAQKRKWRKEQGRSKPFVKKKYAAALVEENHDAKMAPVYWRPLFFLGVFPVFLSIVLVLNRDDLREEVNDKGIGRFLEDYKRWRRAPPRTPLPPTEEHQQEEHESEYETMLKELEAHQNVASRQATGNISSNP